MKTKFASFFVTSLLILSLLFVPGLFPQPVVAQTAAGEFVPGELIVGFRAGVTGATAQGALSQVLPRIGAAIKKAPADMERLLPAEEYPGLAQAPKAFLLRVKDTSPQGMAKATSQLKAIRGVQFVEPNGIYRIPVPQMEKKVEQKRQPEVKPELLTNDPMLVYQWGYFNIKNYLTPWPLPPAPEIAIIDTGVDYTHPELKLGTKVIKGPDFVNGDLDPMDDNGHGTHCAGIAAAETNNNLGIAGTSPRSKIFAVKVLSSQGWGTWFDVGWGIIAAANRTAVKVLNLSLGGGSSSWIEFCVNYAFVTKGKVVCAAAGNDDTTDPRYPAAYTNCIAVAANGDDPFWNPDGKAGFSNYGDWVDIAAPGEDIVSTLPMSLYPVGYDAWPGTSMSTPFVAGAAARVWAQNPGWTNTLVRNQLETTADFIPLDGQEPEPWDWPDPSPFGRLNLHAALGGTTTGANTGIWGIVRDAVTGNPLVGAKVTATRTSPATPAFSRYEYVVAVWGEFLIANLLPGTYKVTISKTGYATVTLTGIVVTSVTYLDLIPVAPLGPKWVVAVVWDAPGDGADLVGWLPPATPYVLYWGNSVGAMTGFPWARWNRASWLDGIPLQSISIKTVLPGTYTFALYAYGDIPAVAWVYSGSTLKARIPISGATTIGNDQWWHICNITGTTVTPINTVGDYPGPYGSATIDPQTGRVKVSPQEAPKERPKIQPVPQR